MNIKSTRETMCKEECPYTVYTVSLCNQPNILIKVYTQGA